MTGRTWLSIPTSASTARRAGCSFGRRRPRSLGGVRGLRVALRPPAVRWRRMRRSRAGSDARSRPDHRGAIRSHEGPARRLTAVRGAAPLGPRTAGTVARQARSLVTFPMRRADACDQLPAVAGQRLLGCACDRPPTGWCGRRRGRGGADRRAGGRRCGWVGGTQVAAVVVSPPLPLVGDDRPLLAGEPRRARVRPTRVGHLREEHVDNIRRDVPELHLGLLPFGLPW